MFLLNLILGTKSLTTRTEITILHKYICLRSLGSQKYSQWNETSYYEQGKMDAGHIYLTLYSLEYVSMSTFY